MKTKTPTLNAGAQRERDAILAQEELRRQTGRIGEGEEVNVYTVTVTYRNGDNPFDRTVVAESAEEAARKTTSFFTDQHDYDAIVIAVKKIGWGVIGVSEGVK